MPPLSSTYVPLLAPSSARLSAPFCRHLCPMLALDVECLAGRATQGVLDAGPDVAQADEAMCRIAVIGSAILGA